MFVRIVFRLLINSPLCSSNTNYTSSVTMVTNSVTMVTSGIKFNLDITFLFTTCHCCEMTDVTLCQHIRKRLFNFIIGFKDLHYTRRSVNRRTGRNSCGYQKNFMYVYLILKSF